ncbi:MAG: heme NO-binding domain-containing protein [Sulfitobacter sp.]
MHGLINRSIQNYVTDRYGPRIWARATELAELEGANFEAMLVYEDAITPRLLDAAAQVLGRGREELMEDIGTYLVSHVEAVRRLLRFGGVNFEEFLHSLDDLPDRARLAVSDLILPGIELRELERGRFRLDCESHVAGIGFVLMGVLRVMADDFGALALLEYEGSAGGRESIMISLVESDFAQGRDFELGARAG